MFHDLLQRLDNNNMAQTVAATAAKVTGGASAATIGLSAGLDVPRLLGYTVDEWQIIGVMTGIVIGFGGLMISATFHFLNYRLARRKAGDG